MRIGVIGETMLERVALALGWVPLPLAHSFFTFMLARAIMEATELGVFDVLAEGPLSAAQVAARLDAHPRACEQLLNVLVAARYLRHRRGRYHLGRVPRRWLLDRPGSVRPKVLLQFQEWEWWTHTGTYLRTGNPLDIHTNLSQEQWGLYQRAMRSGNALFADQVARRLRLPRSPRRMLDVGGSHGYFSVALCRRHPTLSATVLDLPEAIEHAAPLLAREGMGDRVQHRVGDALTDDLGTGWDLILVANLVHHFDAEQNLALTRRCAEALRPGGVLAVFESFRVDPGQGSTLLGTLLDLYFGLTSRSGTWSSDEIAAWQRAAGLSPRAPLRLRMVRDQGVQAADRRR